MKKVLFLFACGAVVSVSAYAQQCMTISKMCTYAENEKKKKSTSTNTEEVEDAGEPKYENAEAFGLLGSGNLNTEAFEKANASGKLSLYVRPYVNVAKQENLTIYLSFNKNVTRKDSLFTPSLVFPDLSDNSFDLTLEYAKGFNNNHYISFYWDSYIKEFSVGKADSIANSFTTLNTNWGFKYLFHSNDDVLFSSTIFYSYNSVLAKKEDDFQRVMDGAGSNYKAPLKYNAFGVKIAAEYKKVQAYIDMRHVFGKSDNNNARQIQGFSYNIGFVVTADIFGAD